MDATQIMMIPVAAETGMAAGVQADGAKSATADSSNGFGELLVQSMLGRTEQETTPTSETDSEQVTEVASLQVMGLNLILASQLAAFQMNTPPLQQLTTDVLSIKADEADQGVASITSGVDVPVAFGSPTAKELVTEAEVESKTVQTDLDQAINVNNDLKQADTTVAKSALEITRNNTSLEVVNPSAFAKDAALAGLINQGAGESQLHIMPAGKSVGEEPRQQIVSSVSRQGDDGQQQSAVPAVKQGSEELQQSTAPAVKQGIVEYQQSTTTTIKQESGKLTHLASPSLQDTGEIRNTENNLKEALPVSGEKVQVKNSTIPELQTAVESQQLPQELTVGPKSSTSTAVQPVRFAQATDVVLAASATGGQNGLSSDAEQRNTPTDIKPIKITSSANEAVQSGGGPVAEQQVVELHASEHQLPHHQMGQKLVARSEEMAVETVTAVIPEQISRQVTERLTGHEIKQGSDQISFKLSPENLGNLQLNMRMEDQRLKLEIVAENREVRNALLQQVDDLKETLAKQNIRMDSFDVTMSNNGNLPQQPRDWRQMNPEQRQYQPQNYASRATGGSSNFETPVRYIAPQYQSTIDVRF